MVDDVGLTLAEPSTGTKLKLFINTAVALLVRQLSVVVCPAVIVVDANPKESQWGGTGNVVLVPLARAPAAAS